ncbi:hypothetical protein C8Q73DRAFT_787848 [Cubamyces lactineus]|nr:hypothetical protein C8Q73DRAFT_787848 [Cubamyces lactineus]
MERPTYSGRGGTQTDTTVGTAALKPTHHHDQAQQDQPDMDVAEAWRECAKVVKEYNSEIVKRWKAEIDTLLVYAGLFSAVLTAFNVESYSELQPQATDTTNALLMQLSLQLTNSSDTSRSSTLLQGFSAGGESPPFRAPWSAIWINTLWFSSLVCSLSAAFVGMMVKQWLHEAELGLYGTSREVARLRQFRHDSLLKWHVDTIVSTLPLLLQLASVLFFAGLLVLLWTLHRAVAITVSALVGILLAFTIATIVAPAFFKDCCYRSPQALSIVLFKRAAQQLSKRALRAHKTSGLQTSLWYDLWCDLGRPFSSQRKGQDWTVIEREVLESSSDYYDQRVIEAADAQVLGDGFLDRVARPCIQTLPPLQAINALSRLLFSNGRSWADSGRNDMKANLILDVLDVYTKACYDLKAPQHGSMRARNQAITDCSGAVQRVLDDLRVSIRPDNWHCRERLFRILAPMIKGRLNPDVRSIAAAAVIGQFSIASFNTTLSQDLCAETNHGAGARQVITALRSSPLIVWGSVSPETYPTSEHICTQIMFLAVCVVRPKYGFVSAKERDFILEHLRGALLDLHHFLSDPGNYKTMTPRKRLASFIQRLSPVLKELHEQLPLGFVTPELVLRLARASDWLGRQDGPEIVYRSVTSVRGRSFPMLRDRYEEPPALRALVSMVLQKNGDQPPYQPPLPVICTPAPLQPRPCYLP